MKYLICYTLDIDIPIQSNIAEKSLFSSTVIAIKHFWLIKSSTPTKSVFLWLAQLSQFINSPTNGLAHIKSKSLFIHPVTNSNRIESKSLLIGPPTNSKRTKSKSFSDNCCKSNGIKSKGVGNKKIEKDNSEGSEQYGQAINNFQLILNFTGKPCKIRLVYKQTNLRVLCGYTRPLDYRINIQINSSQMVIGRSIQRSCIAS